jgi:hypothetical protein
LNKIKEKIILYKVAHIRILFKNNILFLKINLNYIKCKKEEVIYVLY